MTKEKAQVGDLVLIVNAYTRHGHYKNGDIFEVSGRWSGGVILKLDTPYNDIYDSEYEIYRKAGEEDEVPVVQTTDAVNPQHYKQFRVEVIDIIEDAVQGADPFEAALHANIVKYTLRYRNKNGIEDLRKSIWYTEKLIAHLESKNK